MRFLLSALFLFLPLSGATAQTPLDAAIMQHFPLTKATADRTDLVTAGAVMTLKKDGVIMFATTAASKANLIYKDGKVQPSLPTRMAAFGLNGQPASNIVQRTYVAGEKLWLIDVKDLSDGVVLQLLSDPVGDVRYTTFLKLPAPRGSALAPDVAVRELGEVMQPDMPAQAPPAAAPPPPAPVAAAPPLPKIAPPPPPADEAAAPPPTLEKGQSKDKVLAGFGQPLRVVKIGSTKEIDYYKDMKVTYVGGKVTDVQ